MREHARLALGAEGVLDEALAQGLAQVARRPASTQRFQRGRSSLRARSGSCRRSRSSRSTNAAGSSGAAARSTCQRR